MKASAGQVATEIININSVNVNKPEYIINKCQQSESFLFNFLTNDEIFIYENTKDDYIKSMIQSQVYDLMYIIFV